MSLITYYIILLFTYFIYLTYLTEYSLPRILHYIIFDFLLTAFLSHFYMILSHFS